MSKQPHANKMRKKCGAKTRNGGTCKNWAMANGRCRMHGGKSTGPPKNNQNAKKHGFFSKYIPEETLEIMGMLEEKSPEDLIWDQIMIQYAAIIRAQKIMFVDDKNEIVKELKRERETENGIEVEYEFQFAWDRHATFLNAQSRAMSELRSLIKQFNELAHDNDERKLKLQLMQANIDKANAEIEKIKKEQDGEAPPQITIIDEWTDNDD